ncbi:MAG TPA: 2-oxoacid:acceptor oxidoreductase family protein [Spirochaetota bacterium]|nr:2-oxoacid:acceptor oxidoreductase family protein [Spirochaetota bacterium]
MYRIRFHGRGGQGMKTSSRILGTAFFYEGFEVQDAPKYGAERRGAPMSAYVRADKKSIFERGIIHNPDLVVVSDESLLTAIPETLIEGTTSQTVLLVNSTGSVSEWKEKFGIKPEIIYLPLQRGTGNTESAVHIVSTACAAAAAGLTGVISWGNVEKALREEHSPLNESAIRENIETALYAYEEIKSSPRTLRQGDDSSSRINNPKWTELQFHHSGLSAPAIHHAGTSIKNITGSWRVFRPEIKEDICSRCSLCSGYCPDNAIKIKEDGYPEIDYAHCKGCLICSTVCPKHAIEFHPENSPHKRSHYRGDV